MVYFVHTPSFPAGVEREFPDHIRITETLFAVAADEDFDFDLVRETVKAYFEAGTPVVVIAPFQASWTLANDNAVEAFFAKHKPDCEFW